MIKQTIIAAAILAVAGGAAYAEDKPAAQTEKSPVATVVETLDVNVTGEVRAFVEGSSTNDHDLEVKSTDTHLGVDARSKGITYVFGHVSASVDVNGDGNDDVTTNYGYVGVGHQVYGELSAGKTKSIMENFVNKTDVFYNAGNTGVQKTEKKMRNSIKYTNELSDIKFGAQAQMTDDAQDKTLDLYQIGAEYMGVGVAYAKDALNDINYYGVGVSKDIDKFIVAASYTVKDAANDANDVNGYELVGGYRVTDRATVLAGYQDTDVTGDDGTVTAGVQYSLFKDTTWFTNMDYDVDASDYTYRTGISLVF